jgi:hypothetical protein
MRTLYATEATAHGGRDGNALQEYKGPPDLYY